MSMELNESPDPAFSPVTHLSGQMRAILGAII